MDESIEMFQEELHTEQGKVLTSFTPIERLLMEFISLHYFKRVDSLFYAEVLSDGSFGFHLLRKIFLKVVQRHYKDYPKIDIKELSEALTIVSNKRNVIAHGLPSIIFDTPGIGSPTTLQRKIHHEGGFKPFEDELTAYWKYHRVVEEELVLMVTKLRSTL